MSGQRHTLDWGTLPKSELHVHLRGAMPIEAFTAQLNHYGCADLERRMRPDQWQRCQADATIRALLAERSWTTAQVARLFDYRDFDQFLHAFFLTGLFFRTPDDFRRLIDGVLGSFVQQSIIYAEVTVSALEYVRQGIPLPDLVACLDEAAERRDIRVQWIVDLVRDFGPARTLTLLQEIIALGSRSIVGITLGGSEHRWPPAQFTAIYDLARAHGVRLTVHAGEALGPESVWDALHLLKVERIGHGVRSIEDPHLVEHLATVGVPLEVCPTSNLRTGIYPSYAAHPARALVEAGIPITLNSDDPTFFGASLADEYRFLSQAGLSDEALLEIARNGFRYAFLPDSERRQLMARLDAALTDTS